MMGIPQNVPEQQSLGTVSGTVVDQNGNFVVSARVGLAREAPGGEQEVLSDRDGHYVFTGIAAGSFQLTISADRFATQTRSGMLHSGEALEIPEITLAVAAAVTEVRVSVTRYELAEEQVKVEETQRVLGFIPNFYVSYDQHALPLTPKQKFELAWKTNVDPVTFAATGVVAGVQQAEDVFSGYGQGAQGYAKRYGASYGDGVIGTMIGGFILPSLLKQDPRYFYKGSGGTGSRILYALANAVVCKGDNGRWQPNYSGILGSLAAGGISNFYYPPKDRDGVGLTFENTLIDIGSSGVANLFQEFLVRKLTPHARASQTVKP
jgi:Carboxypeptidase regulatory-like domain